MADDPLMTITLLKDGDGFKAALHAPSNVAGMADLRVTAVGQVAFEALHKCLEGLEAFAQGPGDRGAIAKRFLI